MMPLFFRAYLFAWFFWLGMPLGGIALLLLHRLTGGDWGLRTRPAALAAARTMPLLAVLFVPLCFGLPALYPWARPDAHADAVLAHRMPYLNVPFFLVRAALCFVIWIVLMLVATRPRLSRGMASAGLIVYLLTMTHAGFDWVMSRDTEFYSTTFGFIVTVGQVLGALAWCVAMVFRLPPTSEPPPTAMTGPRPLLNDLGNLLLTLVILFAYVSFMQLLVIWMGNTREDNGFYLERGLSGAGFGGPWRLMGLGLVVFHFFVPFVLLLMRGAKQNLRSLLAISWLLLAAHALHDYWMIAPGDVRPRAYFAPHWLDAALLLAIGALWCGAFFLLLRRADAPPAPALPGKGALAHE